MKNKITFIVPTNKDGGGNRWSFMLASNLANKDNYDIDFIMPNYKDFTNIYSLNKKVKLTTYKPQNNFKIISIFRFIIFLKKNISEDRTIVVSDPILSIFMFFFKNKVIRNVASDDYNLFNFTKYKFIGIVRIYKILTFFSFHYKNVKFVYNSVYTYKCIYSKMSFPFFFNNKNPIIIAPFIDNKYLTIPINEKINRENSIVIFPRKHNSKGFKMISDLNNSGTFIKLGIKKIYLVYNKSEHLKDFENDNFTLVNPKNDEEIIKILDKSICFISTSSSEGFGLPPIEAMSRKCIPIIVDAGGTSSFCNNLYNCLISKSDDKVSLIKNIELIMNDNSLKEKILKNILIFPKIFSENNATKNWENYISNLDDHEINNQIRIKQFFSVGLIEKFIHTFKGMDNKLKVHILVELICWPLFTLKNIFFNFSAYFVKEKETKVKREGEETSIAICIQDWINYQEKRIKVLKNGYFYTCGIKNQFQKFISKKYNPFKYLYISKDNIESQKKYTDFINQGYEIVYNSNEYLDFSSYSNFYQKNKDKDILIFMNSSVSTEFNQPILDNYIDYFKDNNDIGLFGISANSKKYQSIIPFGFNPHIQSIFFITTSKILEKVIQKNDGFFPGINITEYNKYRLIIDGEIKLNQIILELGYSIAFVDEYGEVNKYSKNKIFKSKYSWAKPTGDLRLKTNYPSQANFIKKN
jgi:hypothetical protein